METSKINKTIGKVVEFLGQVFLTLLSGVFGLMSIVCLVASIVEGDLINVIGCVGFAGAAWICWDIRRCV